MRKRILSLLLAIAMLSSLFAGITVTVSAAEGTYTLVTDVSTLQAGDVIVLGCAAKNVASGVFISKYLGSVDVTITNGKLTSDKVKPITLGGEAGAWTLSIDGSPIGTSAAKALQLGGGTTTWTIAIAADGTATITSTVSSYGTIKYNAGSPRFLNYASGQTAIEIYRLDTSACQHPNATYEAVKEPTCTEAGEYSWTCPDCSETWTTYPEATGHTYDENGVCSCGDVRRTYELVTDVSVLTAGDSLIIVVEKNGTYYAMAPYESGNNCKAVAVTVSDNTVTPVTGVAELTLGGNATDGWTLHDGNYYLYAASTSKNYLKGQEELDSNNYGLWNITVTDGTTTVQSVGNTSRGTMKFNNSNDWFACYSSTSTSTELNAVSIYRLAGTTTEHTHEGTLVAAKDARCTEAGNISYYKCECGKCFSDAECTTEITEYTIEALGHDYKDGICSRCGDTQFVLITDITTLAAGDKVMIYHPTSGTAISTTASGAKLKGVSGTVTGDVLVATGAAVLTVGGDAEGYTFATEDGLYLTSAATGQGLSFAAAPTEDATDYTAWTIAADTTDASVVFVTNTNAAYNGNKQAIEYYSNAFTTFGANTTAAYQLRLYRQAVAGAHTHVWNAGVTEKEATCLETGTTLYTCTVEGCEATKTDVIPATGHSYTTLTDGEECANNCGHHLFTARKETALIDGMTVLFYSESIAMAMDTTVYSTYFNAIAPVAKADDGSTLTIDSGAALMTVEKVEGGYRFKLGENYLSYRGGRNTLVFEPLTDAVVTADETTTDYTVFALENGNALYCVNGDYDYNGNTQKLYLEAYGSDGTERFTTYNCSDPTAAAFTFTFYTTTAACEHSYTETVTTPATCTADGLKTVTCSKCGASYTQVIPATGHNLDENGACQNEGCNYVAKNFAGDWYIAVARTSGNYFYMTNENTKSRFTAEDSGLTELPTEITAPAKGKVFTIEKNADGNYIMSAKYVEGDSKYVGWNVSKNEATLVTAENARAFTVIENENGTVTLSLVLGDGDGTDARYLSLNGNTGNDYFAWYKNTQRYELTLIPVTGEPHEHSYTYTDNEDGTHTGACTCGDTLVSEDHTWVSGTVVDPTCTDEGYTEITCSKCGATDMTDIVDALDHDLVTDAAVAPTCTETGLTAGCHCTRCEYKVEQTVVPAEGHKDYKYTDNEDGSTHKVTCGVCGETIQTAEGHVYVDGACPCGAVEATGPIVDSALVFSSISISMQSNILAEFFIKQETLADYDSFYVDIIREDALEGTQVTRPACNIYDSSGRYGFRIALRSVDMADDLRATIYAEKDGKTYCSEVKIWSVRSGCMERLETYYPYAANYEQYRKYCTVFVDMLNYGAAVQQWSGYNADDLANNQLTEEYQSLATTAIPTISKELTYTNNGLTDATFYYNSLSMVDRVLLGFMIKLPTTDKTNYEVRAKLGDETTVIDGATFSDTDYAKYFKLTFSKLTAMQFRTDVEVTIYDKTTGNAVSETMTTSVEAVAASKLGKQGDAFDKVVYMMLRYGDAVEAYFG